MALVIVIAYFPLQQLYPRGSRYLIILELDGWLSKLWSPLAPLNTRCRIILRTRKVTISLTATHMVFKPSTPEPGYFGQNISDGRRLEADGPAVVGVGPLKKCSCPAWRSGTTYNSIV